jgi:hypothetical protein
MTVEIFSFCDYSQDNGGKLTVVGSFDTIFVQAFPAVHPLLSIATKIRFSVQEEGKHRFLFTFTDLDGNEYFRPMGGEATIGNFRSSTSALVLTMNIVNVELKREGVVTAKLEVDGRELFHSPLHVLKA